MSSAAAVLMLIIRTYDVAGATPREMLAARRAAADIFERARVEVVWKACAALPGSRDPECLAPPRPAELLVRIVDGPQASSPAILGDAYIVDGAYGSLATVYLDRIRRLSAETDAAAGTLLGRAIVHEAGHLLANTSAHTISGLMRAEWTGQQLHQDDPRAWTFSRPEIENIRRGLLQRLTMSRVPPAAVVEPLLPGPAPCGRSSAVGCRPSQ